MYKEGFLLNEIMTFGMLSFIPLVGALSYYYFGDRGPNNNWFICPDVFIDLEILHFFIWVGKDTCTMLPIEKRQLAGVHSISTMRVPGIEHRSSDLSVSTLICCPTSSGLQMFHLDEMKIFYFLKALSLMKFSSFSEV